MIDIGSRICFPQCLKHPVKICFRIPIGMFAQAVHSKDFKYIGNVSLFHRQHFHQLSDDTAKQGLGRFSPEIGVTAVLTVTLLGILQKYIHNHQNIRSCLNINSGLNQSDFVVSFVGNSRNG